MSDLYKNSALCLRKVVMQGHSLKDCVYQQLNQQNSNLIPKVLGLTKGIVKNYDKLGDLVIKCELLDKVPEYSPHKKTKKRKYDKTDGSLWMKLVLAYEYLFNPKGIVSGGSLSQTVIAKLKNSYPNPGSQASQTHAEESISNDESPIPRYLRIDTNKIKMDVFIQDLKKEFGIDSRVDDDFQNVLVIENADSAKLAKFLVDYKGYAVIMDKASNLPIKLSNINPNDIILDFCASPGSKTLAALSELNGEGTVISVENNKKRCYLMIKRLATTGYFDTVAAIDKTTNKFKHLNLSASDYDTVSAPVCFFGNENKLRLLILNLDVLKIGLCKKLGGLCECEKPTNCLNSYLAALKIIVSPETNVRVLLDPSCSGSGLIEERKLTNTRMRKLASFQKRLLAHVLSLSIGKNVVYSTCSVYAEENELVVTDVLSVNAVYKPELANFSWHNAPFSLFKSDGRRSHTVPQSILEASLRSAPNSNRTRGFYCIKLVRLD